MSGSDPEPASDRSAPPATDPFTGGGVATPDSASFRAVADTAPVAIWITDRDGACIYLNRAWCEFTGQPEADGLGTGWLGCVHPDDRSLAAGTFTSARDHRNGFRVEYRLRRHDGAYRW